MALRVQSKATGEREDQGELSSGDALELTLRVKGPNRSETQDKGQSPRGRDGMACGSGSDGFIGRLLCAGSMSEPSENL